MADLKISQLTSATLPLAGTEVLPIVQSSSTKKVATDDLTVKNVRSNATTGILQVAGPAAAATRTMTVPDANFTAARTDAAQSFTGDQTLGTGNLIQGTAGKGINFTANTPAAGMTSQLLNWYEEGTFTAGLTCGSGSVTLKSTNNTCAYTRIGRQVTITGYLEINTASTPSGSLLLTGLPFTIKNANSAYPTGIPFLNTTGAIVGTPVMLGYTNTTTISFRRMSGGSALDDMALYLGANSQIIFTFVYIV